MACSSLLLKIEYSDLYIIIIIIIIIIINCNWAYARWQCYKNWTYIQEMDIHSKETKHTRHISRRNSISQKISQYSTSATNRIQDTINRIQDTKHRKTNRTQENNRIHINNKTRKQGKSYCRELNPGLQACSSSLSYELSRPCV
jgi:hypothetical protein